jgi:uncharacterized protein YciI
VYFLLFYDYVDNIFERRAPHRDLHLALVQEFVATNEIVFGGAFADPADGAMIVFNVENKTRVEEFVLKDPYVTNKLVTGWRIRQWAVVAGTAHTAGR